MAVKTTRRAIFCFRCWPVVERSNFFFELLSPAAVALASVTSSIFPVGSVRRYDAYFVNLMQQQQQNVINTNLPLPQYNHYLHIMLPG